MYIHTNLKYLRNKNLFKQEFVAQKLGIPKTTYGTYERGTYEPNIATLIKLSDLAWKAGIDLVQLQMQLGHTEITTTMEYLKNLGLHDLAKLKANFPAI